MFFKCIFAFLLVTATTLPSVWYHGRMTSRWSANEVVAFHANEIKSVPREFAEWRLVDEGEPLADYVTTELGIHGYFNRIYENDTGDRVTALLMVGDAGPLVRHPVEICYGNKAKKLVHSVDLKIGHGNAPKEFGVRRYEPKSALEDEFYVAFSFCYDDIGKHPPCRDTNTVENPCCTNCRYLRTHAILQNENPRHISSTSSKSFLPSFGNSDSQHSNQ